MEQALEIIAIIGTYVFAVTGASIGIKSKFDFFGMLSLAFLTAVGGGTTRDIMLNQLPFWVEDPTYLYIILFATFTSLFLNRAFNKLRPLLFFIDTLGLGLYAVLGTQKALAFGMNYETSIIMGVISGVLGGVLRSIFSTQIPIIFRKEVYATSAALASISYILLLKSNLSGELNLVLATFIGMSLRYIAVKFKIHSAEPEI